MNGWEGFLSRISQDNRIEFFMAAFTLKLVAKTKVQKDIKQINMNVSPGSFNCSTEAKLKALPVHQSSFKLFISPE